MSTHASDGAPVGRRDLERLPGETNRDCIARLAGQLRAAEHDRDEAQARLAALAQPIGRVWRALDGTVIVQAASDDTDSSAFLPEGAVELLPREVLV